MWLVRLILSLSLFIRRERVYGMRIFDEKNPLMLSKLFSFGHRKSGKKHVDGEA